MDRIYKSFAITDGYIYGAQNEFQAAEKVFSRVGPFSEDAALVAASAEAARDAFVNWIADQSRGVKPEPHENAAAELCLADGCDAQTRFFYVVPGLLSFVDSARIHLCGEHHSRAGLIDVLNTIFEV